MHDTLGIGYKIEDARVHTYKVANYLKYKTIFGNQFLEIRGYEPTEFHNDNWIEIKEQMFTEVENGINE